MARIRTIKPEFFASLTIANLPVTARLTFIGLWTHVDDEGRCVDDPRLIKAAVWPLDDRTAADTEEDVSALEKEGLITRYRVAGKRYLSVTNFGEHQVINRKTKSKFPGPDQGERPDPDPTPGGLTDDSVRDPGGLPSGKEGNREGNRETPTACADAPRADVVHLTVNKRAQALAKAYTDVVPLSKFPAVLAIAKKAINAQRYTDDEIRAALLRLADDGRPVTTDTLRIELEGLPPPRARTDPPPSRNAQILRAAYQRAQADEGTPALPWTAQTP